MEYHMVRTTQISSLSPAEFQAVSDVMNSVGASMFVVLDDGERVRLANTALRLYRRGFRDPAKLRIVCRKAVFSWSN
jgi:hypothetical protein